VSTTLAVIKIEATGSPCRALDFILNDVGSIEHPRVESAWGLRVGEKQRGRSRRPNETAQIQITPTPYAIAFLGLATVLLN
jgi:hypothetical protein